MRFLKVGLIALAVVFALVVGAGAYLLSRIDKNALVREAQAAVKEATGRTLKIGGKVDLRIFFKPAIVAEYIRFSNASWGSRPDMVRARRLEVELARIPLLTGTIRFDRLVIIEPDVLLETARSVRAAIEGDLSLGGRVQTCIVDAAQNMRMISQGDGDYLAVDFRCRIHP